jgi:hypothetical protein
VTRRQQIELLLRSRFDHVATGVRDSLASLKTTRGPAPSKRVECPDCGGEGKRKVRGMAAPCKTCGGSWMGGKLGEVHVFQPGRGWIEVDDYTGQSVSTLAAPQPERMTTVRCDGCGGAGFDPRSEDRRCRYCLGSGVREIPARSLSLTHEGRSSKLSDAGRYEGDQGSEARAKAESFGSFEALDEALRSMRSTHPGYYHSLLVSLGEREGTCRARFVDAAYTWLDRMLPTELRVPRYAADAEERKQRQLRETKGRHSDRRVRSDRDAKIREMRSEGHSPTMIAMRFNLSRSVVYEILGKTNGDEVAA